MIRLDILAEGETEQTFVLGYLSQHLANKNIICTSTLPGKRGGDIRYARFKKELLRLMSHDQTSFFSCMIDYYALDNEFPGFDEAQSIIDAHGRVLFLEDALAQDINRPKFIPYIQLHEFEALIFTDLDKIGNYFLDVPSINRQISDLKEEVSSFSNPEEINSGSNTAPSKRLIRHIPRYDKAKATAGPFIATEIGHNLLRNKCPHFGYWLDKIENLNNLE